MHTGRAVTIDLPEALLLALGQAARAAGCPPSDYLRAVLRGALDRTPARLRPEEEVIRRAVNLAADWVELQHRLRGAGFVLRRAPDGALAVHSWPVERPLLPLAALGLGEADLTLRFAAGFPADVPRRIAVPGTAWSGRAA
jgi:hypothetical protein